MDRNLITLFIIWGIIILLLNPFFPLTMQNDKHFFESYSASSYNDTLLLHQIEKNYSIKIIYRSDLPVSLPGSIDLARRTPLKEMIKKEYPNIDDPNINDWTKVRLLRNWANSNTNYAFNKELTLDSREINHYYQKNATEIFNLFRNENGGVMCGGTAYALQQLYEMYGFESYTVNMGKIGNYTHVVTLVRISNNNQSLLSIQDAYSDNSYTKWGGQPIDYFEMLNLLKNHQDQLIKIESGPNKGRTFFWGKNQNIPNKTILIEGLVYCNNINFSQPIIVSNDYIEFQGKLTPESIDRCNNYRYDGFLNADGYPASQIYLFMYPFSIMSNSGPDYNLLTHAQKIISGNISVTN